MISVTIVVPGAPRAAWQRWSDFARWAEWNPHCRAARLDGPLAVGTGLELNLLHPRGRDFYTRPRLSVVSPGEELAWETTALALSATTHARFAAEPDGTRVSIEADARGRFSAMYRMTLTDRAQATMLVGMLDALRDDLAGGAPAACSPAPGTATR